MKEYILSLDQGTTSSRALLFNHEGKVCHMAQKEFRQIYPKSGWVEHDPFDILQSQLSVAKEVISKVTPKSIRAIGITNQRETIVAWNKTTGKPIYNAIVWQDRRTSKLCEQLKEESKEDFIQKKTGLMIDPYFSASKMKWVLENCTEAKDLVKKNNLCMGTIDTWLVWNLTEGKKFITDTTNASRTMLFNINTLKWDDELLKLFHISPHLLPEVVSSSEVVGYSSVNILGIEAPISGIAGDQHAALFGQMCVEVGMIKNTYGTGCFMLMNIGQKPIFSTQKLLTTVAWKYQGQTSYAIEGSVFIAGAVVQWLRDGLAFFNDASEIEQLASEVEDSGGLYFVPSLTGLGCPYWNSEVRGLMMGLSRGTTKAHIIRAALESIIFQSNDVFEAMQRDTQKPIKELRVDGGASVNNLMMQFQSDISNCAVIRPDVSETTALGAAYFAGLAIRFWQSLDDIKKQWKKDKLFVPQMQEKIRQNKMSKWQLAIKKTLTT